MNEWYKKKMIVRKKIIYTFLLFNFFFSLQDIKLVMCNAESQIDNFFFRFLIAYTKHKTCYLIN